VAKLYAGEIIEEARKVQHQWDQADDEAAEAIKNVEVRHGPVGNGTKELPRGPLLADHMRESLRRHKFSREGGSVGHLGLWQAQQNSGVERFGVKSLGKRLMK
jgi:transcription initiation factor TFIID subunit 11